MAAAPAFFHPARRSPASRRTGCQFALNLSRMRALSLRLTAKLRRYPVRLAVCALAACLFALPASADVVAHIDNATQRMTVVVDGAAIHSWPVSTWHSLIRFSISPRAQ